MRQQNVVRLGYLFANPQNNSPFLFPLQEAGLQGFIHSFESFGTVDGPGIRFVAFMQGCPLRCKYCHNPDTWEFSAGKTYTPEEVLKEILKYKSYIKSGGVTVSGGEPLMQIEFVTELFKLLKKEGVHTAVDTSGVTFNAGNERSVKAHEELIKFTDLVLLDIKHADGEGYRALCGGSLNNTLNFARFLSENGKDIWIRHVLVPGITDDDAQLLKLKAIIKTLKTVKKVEVLPYHNMGEVKYEKLGFNYELKGVKPPTKERIANARRILNG